MHVEKYKGAGVAPVSNHNARVYESRGYRRENIDSSLSGENYRLGPDRGTAKEWVNARVAALGLKRRPRSDAVLMCEWVVTLPESERGGEREFFEAAYGAMAARYGADNVVSCWVHRDEPGARPHMHFDWVPVTRDGRLSAKEVLSRKELLAVHRDLGRELSQALGHEVHLLLPSEERGRRELSRLNDRQYRDAMAERERASAEAASASERAAAAESAQRAAEDAQRAAEDAQRAAEDRLECLQRGVEDAESLAAAGLGEVRRVAREGRYVGGRESAARERNRELRARVEALEGEGRELGGRCESLEAEKAGSPAEIQGLERDVRRLGGRVRELRRERCELAGRVRELERDRDGLERRVAELRGHVQAAWRKLVTRARAFRGWLRVPRELEWVCRDLADCVEGFRRADDRCWGSDGRAPQRDATLHPSPDDLIRQARADVMADGRTQPQRRRGFGRAR